MSNSPIAELVAWRSMENVEDREMIAAVEAILPDLKTLPGFISQTLYKDDQGRWVDLYYWDSREEAIASNDLMAPKESFARLMALIEPDSVTIELLELPTG